MAQQEVDRRTLKQAGAGLSVAVRNVGEKDRMCGGSCVDGDRAMHARWVQRWGHDEQEGQRKQDPILG